MAENKDKIMSIRTPEDLWAWLGQKAESEKRSLSGQVNFILEQARRNEKNDSSLQN
jgi:hypothetical protein